MNISNEIIDAIESIGWGFYAEKNGNTIFLQNYSPAGQDLGFEVAAKDDAELVSELESFYERFDPEEETRLWYGQNRGEPSSLKDLLKDMEKSKEMYNRLYLTASRASKLLHVSKSGKKEKFTLEFTSIKTCRKKAFLTIEAESEKQAKEIASTFTYEDFDWTEDTSDEPVEESLTWVAYNKKNQKGGKT